MEFNKIILKNIITETYEICISKLISWKYINKRYYRTLCISLMGSLFISFIVFTFAFLFKNTNSIEGSFPLSNLDYFYYSAVTYFTVGYGDIVPTKGNNIGEILFICECFISLITNSIFIGTLTYNLMRTYNSIIISKFIYIVEEEGVGEEGGKFVLRFRIGDFENLFINFSYSIQLFDWYKNKFRDPYYRFNEILPDMEYVYNTSLTILESDNTINDKVTHFFKKLLKENKSNQRQFNIICVTLTSTSTKTGDTAIVRKYYREKDIIFIETCKDVYDWIDTPPYMTFRKWINFDKYIEMDNNKKEIFINRLNNAKTTAANTA